MIAVEVQRNPGAFDCKRCRHHHCDATGTWPESRGPAGYDLYEIPGVITSRVCLLPLVTGETAALLELYAHYKNRLLPFAGGLLDQPHYYLAAMAQLERMKS